MVPRGGSSGSNSRSGPPPGSVGAARRRQGGRTSNSNSGFRQNVMNFYTDDAPGLKISPVMVLVMSLGFIGFVTILHVIGKIRG
uniref:Protein transport protein SEC61 subunit beta n=1 Tax=Tetraselmis sp. GSL018 TaxID=582737 RepID=A0A061SPV2_9CHLO|mmetsp:Transcript_17683/g.42414  ORF Transcript_17683/g.42414 Transcript_17683/m.42414 type:complete len:84 (+) Transcript_17683:227-478(+)